MRQRAPMTKSEQVAPKPSRGGARTGAGRKAETTDGGPLEAVTVNLDKTTIADAKAYGDGELSEGIRRAMRTLKLNETKGK